MKYHCPKCAVYDISAKFYYFLVFLLYIRFIGIQEIASVSKIQQRIYSDTELIKIVAFPKGFAHSFIFSSLHIFLCPIFIYGSFAHS